MSASGRGRLPTCEVRIRRSLRFIVSPPFRVSTLVYCLQDIACMYRVAQIPLVLADDPPDPFAWSGRERKNPGVALSARSTASPICSPADTYPGGTNFREPTFRLRFRSDRQALRTSKRDPGKYSRCPR